MISAVASSPLISKIIINIIAPVSQLLLALAVVYFLYGVIVFFKNSDSSDERQIGSRHMMWGLVGIVIMTSVFGILSFIKGSISELGGNPRDTQQIENQLKDSIGNLGK